MAPLLMGGHFRDEIQGMGHRPEEAQGQDGAKASEGRSHPCPEQQREASVYLRKSNTCNQRPSVCRRVQEPPVAWVVSVLRECRGI